MLLSTGLHSSVTWTLALAPAISLASALLVGCGGTESPGPSAPAPSISGEDPAVEPTAETATPVTPVEPISEIKRIVNGQGYDLSTGRELPNLKAGTAKATIAAPKGWVLPTRRPEYVVWFAKELGEEFPRILVTAEPAPAGAPDTTESNVDELVQKVAASVSNPLEPVKPLIIGDVPCVRYVSAAKSKSTSLEEQVLKTIRKGQLFTVTLQAAVVTPGESPLLQYRDAGYAVLASLKAEADAAAETPATPPAETPAPPTDAAPAGS